MYPRCEKSSLYDGVAIVVLKLYLIRPIIYLPVYFVVKIKYLKYIITRPNSIHKIPNNY